MKPWQIILASAVAAVALLVLFIWITIQVILRQTVEMWP